jgi:hypothetical protein
MAPQHACVFTRPRPTSVIRHRAMIFGDLVGKLDVLVVDCENKTPQQDLAAPLAGRVRCFPNEVGSPHEHLYACTPRRGRGILVAVNLAGFAMIAVIIEMWLAPGREDDYLKFAASLRRELEGIDGFISVERFQSLTEPGKMLSLSIWRDEAAVRACVPIPLTVPLKRPAAAAFSPTTARVSHPWCATTACTNGHRCRRIPGPCMTRRRRSKGPHTPKLTDWFYGLWHKADEVALLQSCLFLKSKQTSIVCGSAVRS